MAYPTLSTLKAHLRINDTTEDTVLQFILDEAISWVQTFTGRIWSSAPTAITDEAYDLDSITQTRDSSFIMLKQMDIISIVNVKLGGSLVDSASYKFTPEGRLIVFGRVFDNASRAFNDYQVITVSYTYGAVAPTAIEGAILRLAMAYWNERLTMANQALGPATESTGKNIKQEKIGEYQVTYENTNTVAVSESVKQQLSSYRKRRI